MKFPPSYSKACAQLTLTHHLLFFPFRTNYCHQLLTHFAAGRKVQHAVVWSWFVHAWQGWCAAPPLAIFYYICFIQPHPTNQPNMLLISTTWRHIWSCIHNKYVREDKSKPSPERWSPMSWPAKPLSGTLRSFYCLPDCHGRLADLRTWEELVLLTLAMPSLLCSFQSDVVPGSYSPVTSPRGHGSVKHLLWQIVTGWLAHGDSRRWSA